MASETYYFFFSIVLVVAITIHLCNMAYFRIKGQTIIGNRYRPDTPEYQALTKFASRRNLVLAIIIALVLIGNLIFDVHRLLLMQNHSYAYGILIYAPVSCVVLSVILVFYARSRFGQGQSKK